MAFEVQGRGVDSDLRADEYTGVVLGDGTEKLAQEAMRYLSQLHWISSLAGRMLGG